MKRSIAGILARWAPATDTIGSLPGAPPNSPKEYSDFVSARMGIGPNEQLRLFDEEGDIEELGQLKDLFFAMAAFEIGRPKPGLLVEQTGEREAILIHPGNGYLNSIGCLNPATAFKTANSNIDFSDSRSGVIAIIEALKSAMGDEFPKSGGIPNATILIEGEPT